MDQESHTHAARDPSAAEPDHLACVRLLACHEAIMRLESEIRLMRADEESRIARAIRAMDRAFGPGGRAEGS